MINVKKYKEINELFKIITITDNYIVSKVNNIRKKIYIYSISPITLLNVSLDIQNNILNIYNEFLREFDNDFQILCKNSKLEVEDLFCQNTNISALDIYNKYIEDMKEKLRCKEIYITKYYIIVYQTSDSKFDLNQIDRCIYKLENIGCRVVKLKGKEKLKKILYESINKEILKGVDNA